MSKYTESVDMIKVSLNHYIIKNTNNSLGSQVLICRNLKSTNLFELSWLVVSIANNFLVVSVKFKEVI